MKFVTITQPIIDDCARCQSDQIIREKRTGEKFCVCREYFANENNCHELMLNYELELLK